MVEDAVMLHEMLDEIKQKNFQITVKIVKEFFGRE